jgi:hypothetical protein
VRKSSLFAANSTLNRCISTEAAGPLRCSAVSPRRLAFVLHPDAYHRRRLHQRFEFLGRTGRGRSTLAEAAAARHQVRVRTTILETRASNSRPEIGFVKCLFELLDEQDTVLITLTSPLMIRRREAGARP